MVSNFSCEELQKHTVQKKRAKAAVLCYTQKPKRKANTPRGSIISSDAKLIKKDL